MKRRGCVTGLLPLVLLAACDPQNLASLRLSLPAAANAPQVVLIDAGLPYVERTDRTLRFDLYRPAFAPRPLPLVILIHGGSWRNGSRDMMIEFAYDVAAHGYAAASIDYRLANAVSKFPDPVADVLASVRYFRDHAAEFDVAGDRVALFGLSAGGHLALMAGMPADASPFDPDSPPGEPAGVRAIVNLFGPTDLTVDPATADDWQIRTVERFIGARIDESAELLRLASPVSHARSNGPPVLTLHGDADTVVPVTQARSLAAALDAAMQPHFFIEIPGMGHLDGAFWYGPAAQAYRPIVFAFLQAHL